MRISIAAAAACLGLVSLTLAQNSLAEVNRPPIAIPAEELGTALQDLAKARDFQVICRADLVKGLRSQAVSGNFTPYEALTELLSGTGLTYKSLDSRTVTIVPLQQASGSSAEGDHADADKKSGSGQQPYLAQATPSGQGDQGNSTDQTATPSKASGLESARQGDSEQGSEQPAEPYRANTPEVLIRGTRIMNVDVKRTEDDAQPYYILDSKQIEQSGSASLEQFLKSQLTMNTAFQTNSQQAANVFGNLSQINLRGLGTGETLILIDGRRSAAVGFLNTGNSGAFGAPQPDINGIPLAAIERIEVLPGSASAIYGGAAVGGVVNIVLKKRFQGGEVHLTYDNPESGHAPQRTLSATYGLPLEDGRTHILVAGQYADGEVLFNRDRQNLVQRGVSAILRNSPSFLFSPFSPFPGATPNITSIDGSNLVLNNGTPLGSPITFIPPGTAPGSDISPGLLSNAGRYNLNPPDSNDLNGLRAPIGNAPTTKYLTGTVRREMTDSLQFFAEVSTSSNSTHIVQGGVGTLFVPAGAPTNPFKQDVLVFTPLNADSPLDTDSVTHSVTTGLVVRLPAQWSSELDYTWSQNLFESRQSASTDGVAISRDIASGVLNPFVDTIAHPFNVKNYLSISAFSNHSSLNDLGLRASGPIGRWLWGDPTLTVGVEHRKEGFDDSHNSVVYPSDSLLNQDEIIFGQSQSTNSLYAEALVPLVSEQNAHPGVRALELQLAGRTERYTVYNKTAFEFLSPSFLVPFNPPQGVHSTVSYSSTNPTIALKYKPFAPLMLRASYARAFLPPTASQLLRDSHLQCGPTPCLLITDPKTGETYSVNFTGGGNPGLQPQTSRDWDLGLVFAPVAGALQGLRIDLEHYEITQPNFITQPQAQDVLTNPAFAGRVTRDPVTGRVTVLDLSDVNATLYSTAGWDVKIDYQKSTPIGTFELYALGTRIDRDLRQSTIGAPENDFVDFPADGGEGKLKANGTLSWENRGWRLGWSTTYYSSYRQSGAPGDPFGVNTTFTDAQGGFTIPSQIYHDLFGSYTFGGAQGNGAVRNVLADLTIQFGIRNVFNTLPPFDAHTPVYYYSTYGDSRLRDFRISLRKSF